MDRSVDMHADIDAINRGDGRRAGERWTVHGRTYHVEATGHSWPIDGPGVHTLDRGAFLALAVYNELGLTVAAERQLDRDGVADEARADARRVWSAERDAP